MDPIDLIIDLQLKAPSLITRMQVKWRYASSIIGISVSGGGSKDDMSELFKIQNPETSSEAPVVFDLKFFPTVSSSASRSSTNQIIFGSPASGGDPAGNLQSVSFVSICIKPKNSNSGFAVIALEMEGVEVGRNAKEYEGILQENLENLEAVATKHESAVQQLNNLVAECVKEKSPPLQLIPSLSDWEASMGFSYSLDAIRLAYKECVTWKKKRYVLVSKVSRIDEANFLLRLGYECENKGIAQLKAQEESRWTRERVFYNTGVLMSFLHNAELTTPSLLKLFTADRLKTLFVHFIVCGSLETRRKTALLIKKIFSEFPSDIPLSSSPPSSSSSSTSSPSPSLSSSPSSPFPFADLQVEEEKSAVQPLSASTIATIESLEDLPALFLNDFLTEKYSTSLQVNEPNLFTIYFYNTVPVFHVVREATKACNVRGTLRIMNRILLMLQKATSSKLRFFFFSLFSFVLMGSNSFNLDTKKE